MNGTPHLYVADLHVPAAIYSARDDRTAIPNAEELGLIQGYWEIHRTLDDAVKVPDGVRAVIKFWADDLTQAENTALRIGQFIALLTSLTCGSPLRPPRLTRLAKCTSTDGYVETQWDYFYDDHRVRNIPFNTYDFTSISELILRLNPSQRWRIELGARWHGIAAGAGSSVDRFLAAWIALEAVSPILDEKWHPIRRAACEICGTAPGTKRDRTIAGAEHLMNKAIPELLQQISFQEIHDLRSTLVHALNDLPSVENKIDLIANDVVLCSGSAILSSLPTSATVSAALPHDQTDHPDSRAALEFSIPIRTHEPYLDGWIGMERFVLQERKWLSVGGAPNHLFQPGIRYDMRVPKELNGKDFFTKSLVHFVDDATGIDLAPEPGESIAQWRPRERSAAIQRGWKQIDRDGFVVDPALSK